MSPAISRLLNFLFLFRHVADISLYLNLRMLEVTTGLDGDCFREVLLNLSTQSGPNSFSYTNLFLFIIMVGVH